MQCIKMCKLLDHRFLSSLLCSSSAGVSTPSGVLCRQTLSLWLARASFFLARACLSASSPPTTPNSLWAVSAADHRFLEYLPLGLLRYVGLCLSSRLHHDRPPALQHRPPTRYPQIRISRRTLLDLPGPCSEWSPRGGSVHRWVTCGPTVASSLWLVGLDQPGLVLGVVAFLASAVASPCSALGLACLDVL